MKILVSGSLGFDSILDFKDYFKNHILANKIHNINVSFLVDNLRINYGGTAGNIAYNLALLKESPVVLSSAGNDFKEYKERLKKLGIDVSKIKIISKTTTALVHIVTDLGDNQITAFYPGAMKYSCGKINQTLLKNNNLAIIAPGNETDMFELSKAYKKNKTPYIFDPGQQIPALTTTQLKTGINDTMVLISNDYELSMIQNKTGFTEKQILQKAKILITTLGEKGSIIKTKDKTFKIPVAEPKEVKDPTGAGDAYRAGLIKGLISGLNLEQSGQLASVVSVYAVENYGTQNHKFSINEIKKRYRQNFKKDLKI